MLTQSLTVRSSLIAAIAAPMVVCLSTAASAADDVASPAASVTTADLRTRLYRSVERTAQMRRLRGEIRLTEAEIATIDRRLAEYEPMNRFKIGSAVRGTVDRLELERLAAELRLRELEAELSGARRHLPTSTRWSRPRVWALPAGVGAW